MTLSNGARMPDPVIGGKAYPLRSGSKARAGAKASTRFFAGKTLDRASIVTLSDPEGRPRLRLGVDSTGTAGIDFLDAEGRVTDHYPASRRSSQRP